MRDNFVKAQGYTKFCEECKTSERLAKYQDIPVPDQYEWVWGHFIAIWQQCEVDLFGRKILTYGTINDYVECMKVPLSISDKRLIMKMKTWAMQQIDDMEPKED